MYYKFLLDGAVLRDSVRCNNAPFEVFSTKQEIGETNMISKILDIYKC